MKHSLGLLESCDLRNSLEEPLACIIPAFDWPKSFWSPKRMREVVADYGRLQMVMASGP